MTAVHIDSFSTPLADLPVAKKRDRKAVFDAIVERGGFSAFDIDDYLGTPVTYLFQAGLLRDLKTPYPWVKCEATERGLQWREDRAGECGACSGKGYVSVPLSRRTSLAKPCAHCAGSGWISLEDRQ